MNHLIKEVIKMKAKLVVDEHDNEMVLIYVKSPKEKFEQLLGAAHIDNFFCLSDEDNIHNVLREDFECYVDIYLGSAHD